ncbi:TFIID-domain-containing protein [Lactarius hatsudake]|nr:TFIID-domain-containing protein [Lactarius hatsudake]
MAYYPSQSGQLPATSGAYPYNTYPYTHPQTTGAYPYTAGAYPGTAVTGYGAAWPYSYSYYQQPASSLPRPATAQTTATALTTTVPTGTQRTTFSTYNSVYPRETPGTAAPSGTSSRGYKKQSNFKGLFTKELRNLMFGFGDDRNPSNDTVNVMEEILVEYIADVCQTALAPTKKSRLSIEDFRRALSRPADAKKLARMEELLFMQEDIKRARAQFNDSEMNQSKGLPS